MMPTLHNLDTTTENFRDWRTNGAGILNDAISCVVTENRNGEFDLEMTYPLVGVLYDEIKIGSMIMATHDATQIDEVFVVYRITENINGIATIYAHHITYDMNFVVIDSNAKPAGLIGMLSHCNGVAAAASGNPRPATGGRFVNPEDVRYTPDNLYNLYTNRSSQDSKSWLMSAPKSLRSIVFELAEYYGYEIKWGSPPNAYLSPSGSTTVRTARNPRFYTAATLMTARGKDTGASIRYGGNLLSAEKTSDVDSQFARVFPYYGEKTLNDLENTYVSYTITYRGVIDSGEVYFYFTKPFDLNGFFDEQPTQAQVTASSYISDYFVEDKVGEKLESVTINFSPFMDVGYNFDANILQNLCLCDWVNIEIDQLGISKKAKVVKTVYDTLRERYVSLTVGEVEKSFAETVQDGVVAGADSGSDSGGGGTPGAINYSTSETATGGKWIDGKPIYRYTTTFSTTSTSTSTIYFDNNAMPSDWDTVINIYGTMTNPSGFAFALNASLYNSFTVAVYVIASDSASHPNSLAVRFNGSAPSGEKTFYVTVEYTKAL